MDTTDLAPGEKVEQSLDAFINARAREQGEENKLEEAWAATTRRENEKRRSANRWSWIRYHSHLCELKTQSAARHAQERDRLLREAGYDDNPEAA